MKKFLTHDLLMLIVVAALLTVFNIVFADWVEEESKHSKLDANQFNKVESLRLKSQKEKIDQRNNRHSYAGQKLSD